MGSVTIEQYQEELATELNHLLQWWSAYTVDEQQGGFYGQVNHLNQAEPVAKGLVLNARILYTFSSGYLLTQKKQYLAMAQRAYHYLLNFFYDESNGGFFWSLSPNGTMLDGKKQVYGQAFAIYALSEYYKATQDQQAFELAKATYQLLEKYSYDEVYTGYIEAHNQAWGVIADLRLSEKDQNEKKSMNTHLHVIEAYANLYSVWPNGALKNAIVQLLDNFREHIVDAKNFHLHLFFTEDWQVKSSLISFGHDIEAAWLLYEAAEIINDQTQMAYFKQLALKMADAAGKGLAENGGLLYEYDAATAHWIKEYHWWPQAEAMVGFFNAWQLANKEQYLEQSLNSWAFVRKYLKDQANGEWFWGVDENLKPMGEVKAGFWKCPYHNGRACMVLIKRISQRTKLKPC